MTLQLLVCYITFLKPTLQTTSVSFHSSDRDQQDSKQFPYLLDTDIGI